MSTAAVLDNLRSRILARYPLLFLRTWEEDRWERELAELALEMERGLVTWTVTEGVRPPPAGGDAAGRDPLDFLDVLAAWPPDHLFFVKDFHPWLEDPRVRRRLRDLVPRLSERNQSVLLVGPVNDVPLELRKDAVSLDLPLPGFDELRAELSAVIDAQRAGGAPLDATDRDEERLAQAALGLTLAEARKALRRALLGRERIDAEAFKTVVGEKRRLVASSDLLEFHDLDDGIDEVGGLENLKQWLAGRSEAFSPRAREQGIPTPKGVLLLGVQGCGKSLTARAAAKLLSVPLVRLDASNLLHTDRGESEKNLRDVLRLTETIAPAVLWLDEIEKGFAGIEEDAALDATMARLVGGFLTWMEERRAPVFVVATANSVHRLPPEMVRRGRFDELFFIDLPNYQERAHVFRVHLAKRGWKPEKFDLARLAEITEGFSGSEIEQIVVSAVIDSYGQGRILSQADLEAAREATVPLSVTMEERIFELREWARTRCRLATADSRVMQMLDEEDRAGGFQPAESGESAADAWRALAEHGQLNAALVEFVRRRGRVSFPELQEAFADYVEAQGEQGLALRSDPNVVLWTGLGQELSEPLAKLVSARRIYLVPVNAERYRGRRAGRLPLLERLTEERLSRPHWLPACLQYAPPEGGSGRFARVARIRLSRSQ